jgi:hypothetical protein
MMSASGVVIWYWLFVIWGVLGLLSGAGGLVKVHLRLVRSNRSCHIIFRTSGFTLMI